jgi:trehalose-phosphatase
MKIVNPQTNLTSFFSELKQSPKRILFLDYDGTLAPFHENPQDAKPYPGVLNLINKIMQIPGNRLVFISGRWTKDLKPLLPLQKKPEIWGSHGIERLLPNGTYEVEEMDETALKGLTNSDEWMEENDLEKYCEAKPGSLVLHWRGLGDNIIIEIQKRVHPVLDNISKKYGLQMYEFDGGIELRVPGRDKGDAVKTILAEMKDHPCAAYLGDDQSDENAFNAIKGRGLAVLVRKEFRKTNADVWLKPPEELLNFLSTWLKVTGGTNGNS